jgi:hypothetical protein
MNAGIYVQFPCLANLAINERGKSAKKGRRYTLMQPSATFPGKAVEDAFVSLTALPLQDQCRSVKLQLAA